MNRRQYLQLLSLGLVSGAGCTLPTARTEEPIAPGSVKFRNTTSERAELELRGWQTNGGHTATETEYDPDITVSLTAAGNNSALRSEVFSWGDWRLQARTAGYEDTAVVEIRDRDFVSVVLYSDHLRIFISGNNG